LYPQTIPKPEEAKLMKYSLQRRTVCDGRHAKRRNRRLFCDGDRLKLELQAVAPLHWLEPLAKVQERVPLAL
jgi:hypothetical protein